MGAPHRDWDEAEREPRWRLTGDQKAGETPGSPLPLVIGQAQPSTPIFLYVSGAEGGMSALVSQHWGHLLGSWTVPLGGTAHADQRCPHKRQSPTRHGARGGSRTTHSRCLHQQFVWASLPKHSADGESKIQDSPVSRVLPAPGHAGKTQQKPPSSGRNQDSFKETKTRTYKADTNTSREHHQRATKHLAGAPALALRTTGCGTLGRACQLSGLVFLFF